MASYNSASGPRERPGQRVMAFLCLPMAAFVFVLPGVLILFLSENFAARTARGLQEGEAAVTSLPNAEPAPETEGALVHVIGDLKTPDSPTDPEFAVSAPGLRLERHVAVYQWNRQQNTGGGVSDPQAVREGRYVYFREWSEKLLGEPIQQVKGVSHPWSLQCRNPVRKPFENKTIDAGNVRLGGFTASAALVGQLPSEPLKLDAEAFDRAPENTRARVSVRDGVFYSGIDPTRPAVGDARIEFRVVNPTQVSVVARQVGATLEPYQTTTGTNIYLLQPGTVGSATMLKSARSSSIFFAWFVRVFSAGMMSFGFVLCFWLLTLTRPVGMRSSFLGTVRNALVTTAAVSIAVVVWSWGV